MTSFTQIKRMMETREERLIGRYETDDLIIDTCAVTDGIQPFETAVSSTAINPGNFAIVEAYSNAEEARKGHAAWVERMTSDNPPRTLEKVENRKTENDWCFF